MTSPATFPAVRGRLLLSEEGLKDEVGHWFEYCKSVVDIHEACDVDCVVALHQGASRTVLEALPAREVFRRTSWSGLSSEPNLMKRYWGIISHNWLVYRTIEKLVREEGPFDVVFAPTVTIHHLIGWRLLAWKHGRSRIKRLVLLFRNNAGFYAGGSRTPTFKRSTKILRAILKSFEPLLAQERVGFATDSERLADEYELLSGIRPDVYPSPRVAPVNAPPTALPVEARIAAPREIRFSCLGPARMEKGIDTLQKAIAIALSRRSDPGLRFVVQWNQEILDTNGDVYSPDPALRADPRVRLITEPLNSELYNEELSGSDCLILPYRRASYFARISGVAVEAVTAGIPVIYTQDTWCETLVRDCGAGLGAPDGDAEAFAAAVEDVIDNLELYRLRARERAHEARQRNSAEAFVAKLWGNLPSPRRASSERAS